MPAVVSIAVAAGYGPFQSWILSGVFLILALVRPPIPAFQNARCWWVALMFLPAIVTPLSRSLLAVKLYPVLMNAAMLAAFAATLIHPPSMAERIARMREPDLTPKAIAYTRGVTIVWSGFFMVNGSIALITALWASAKIWALYNGLIAYILMGALFAGEYAVRLHLKAQLDA
jgi:uncharacterized membrane protein